MAVVWRPAAAGMELGELALGGTGEAWRLQIVLVRLDSARLRLELVSASREAGTLPDWSLDRLPAGAVLGVNAGQFTGGQPWGWLVRNGTVEQLPAIGALSICALVGAVFLFFAIPRFTTGFLVPMLGHRHPGVVEAAAQFVSGEGVSNIGLGVVVMLVSGVVNIVVSRLGSRSARCATGGSWSR